MAKTKRKTKTTTKRKVATKTKTRVKTKAKEKAKTKAKTKRKSPLSQITYTVSDELASIVGGKKMTRPQIVKKLWEYIKTHKCQDTKNKRLIVPDQELATVIGKKSVDMLKLAGLLSKHIKK